MAVYDDQKTEEPLVDNDDSVSNKDGKSTAADLKGAEDSPLDSVGASPLGDEEQAQLDGIEKNYGDEAPEPDTPFSYKDDSTAKGRLLFGGKQKKRGKKKLLIAGILGGGFAAIIIVIMFFLSSLMLIHFVANIGAYEFARLGRDFGDSVANVTEEKIALDASDETFITGLRQKYQTFRSSTWDKLNKYRPQKVLDNMKAGSELEYVFKQEDRKIFPGTKQVLTGIKINGEEINLGDSKWFQIGGKFNDQLKFNGRLTAQLESALSETNSLVRGRVAQKIRDELSIKLQRWKKLTKTYKNAYEAEADQIKQTAVDTAAESADKSLVSGINDAEAAAKKVADKCDQACLEQFAKDGGKSLSDEVKKQISVSLNDNALSNIAGAGSAIYAIALPTCMIYDGSVEHSGGTVDANSARAVKTFYTASSAAHQQIAGTADPAQIGGLVNEFGDISNAPSELRASGKTVNAANYTNPQANSTQDYSIFSSLFGGTIGKVFNDVLSPTCPTITNPVVGVGTGIIELGITALSGGEVTAGENTLKLGATNLIKRMVEQTFSKEGLKELVGTTVRDVTLIVGGSLLAKLIVSSRMGFMPTAFPIGKPLAVRADQGGNIVANDLDRKQLYGKTMTKEEVVMSNYQDYAQIAYKNSQKSLFERYLSPSNPTSLLTDTAVALNSTFHSSLTKFLNNIITKIGSLFQSNTLFVTLLGSNQRRALAAATGSNYGLVQWGWTSDEEAIISNNPALYSPMNVAESLTRNGKLESLKATYDKCFTSSMGQLLAARDIVRDSDGNILPDTGDCAPNKLGPANQDAFLYRIYMRNENTLDHLGDIQNPTSGTAGTTTPAASITGVPGQDIVPQDNMDKIQCPKSPTVFPDGTDTAYKDNRPYTIQLCLVHGVILNSMAADRYDKLFNGAEAQGITFSINAMGGFRTFQDQTNLYWPNGTSAPHSLNAAVPGTSNHQFGTALDVTCSDSSGTTFTGQTPGEFRGRADFQTAIAKHPCLNWIHLNSPALGLLLMCDGIGPNGGEIGAATGGCETWHMSPTGE